MTTEPLALPDASWDEVVAAIEAEAERLLANTHAASAGERKGAA